MASIRVNYLYNVAYQILKVLAPLVTTPYVSRVLSPHGVGTYSYTYSVANYFVMFAMLGMSTYGVRAIAATGANRERRSTVFCGAYASQLISAAAALIGYGLYLVLADNANMAVTVAWLPWLLACCVDISWLLFGSEDFRIATIRSSAVKFASIILTFVIVRGPGDVWAYAALTAVAFLVEQILVWPFASRYVSFTRPRWREIRIHLAGSAVLFLPVIAISLYTTLDKVMLGLMTDMAQVAYYEYSEKLSKIPLAGITALGTVMLPRMSRFVAGGEKSAAASMVEMAMWLMLGPAIAFAFGIGAIAPVFVPVFFGEGYDPCVRIMMAICAVVPIIAASNAIGQQYLLPCGRDREYTLSVLTGGIVNVLFNLMLIPRMAAMGAAVATIAAELSVLLFQALCVRKDLPLGRMAASAIPFVLSGIVMSASIRLAGARMVGIYDTSVLALAVEILIGSIVYVLLVCGYCLVTRNSHFLKLLGAKGRAFLRVEEED